MFFNAMRDPDITFKLCKSLITVIISQYYVKSVLTIPISLLHTITEIPSIIKLTEQHMI